MIIHASSSSSSSQKNRFIAIAFVHMRVNNTFWFQHHAHITYKNLWTILCIWTFNKRYYWKQRRQVCFPHQHTGESDTGAGSFHSRGWRPVSSISSTSHWEQEHLTPARPHVCLIKLQQHSKPRAIYYSAGRRHTSFLGVDIFILPFFLFFTWTESSWIFLSGEHTRVDTSHQYTKKNVNKMRQKAPPATPTGWNGWNYTQRCKRWNKMSSIIKMLLFLYSSYGSKA